MPPLSSPTPEAGPHVAGAVVVYRLYDVGYEIDLERALDLLAASPGERATLRLTLPPPLERPGDPGAADRLLARRSARAEAQALQIKNPPITSALGPDVITLRGQPHPVQVSARIFDFGVISLRLYIAPADVLSWQQFTAFGNAVDAAPDTAAVFGRHIAALTAHLGPTIARPQLARVTEDYVVYRVTRFDAPDGAALPTAVLRSVDVVPLLLNEQRALSDGARRELLPYWFSYYPDDLAVLTWYSALIVDPTEGDSDVQLILEFANAQLLELRYYDAILDAELPKMYDRIAERRVGGRALFGRRYASLLTALQTLVADSTEIVERAENALKVTDDVFLARVYAAALDLFRARVWRGGIDHKLAIIRQTYAMLNAEAMAARNEVLEAAIIVLIIVEIVIAVVSGRR
ncbi:MAG TPA: hypothetical protein VH137_03685 [Gemmatimonadales bacterium]|nr:hypothetical protein [Gemmatimonadales bacterium]